jgi:hypothetical protein
MVHMDIPMVLSERKKLMIAVPLYIYFEAALRPPVGERRFPRRVHAPPQSL